MTAILELLSSKIFWGILGPLAAGLFVYIKGRRDEGRARDGAAHRAREELRRQILEAEKNNQNKELERDKALKEIGVSTDDDLVGVWDKSWGSKDLDKPSN